MNSILGTRTQDSWFPVKYLSIPKHLPRGLGLIRTHAKYVFPPGKHTLLTLLLATWLPLAREQKQTPCRWVETCLHTCTGSAFSMRRLYPDEPMGPGKMRDSRSRPRSSLHLVLPGLDQRAPSWCILRSEINASLRRCLWLLIMQWSLTDSRLILQTSVQFLWFRMRHEKEPWLRQTLIWILVWAFNCFGISAKSLKLSETQYRELWNASKNIYL